MALRPQARRPELVARAQIGCSRAPAGPRGSQKGAQRAFAGSSEESNASSRWPSGPTRALPDRRTLAGERNEQIVFRTRPISGRRVGANCFPAAAEEPPSAARSARRQVVGRALRSEMKPELLYCAVGLKIIIITSAAAAAQAKPPQGRRTDEPATLIGYSRPVLVSFTSGNPIPN